MTGSPDRSYRALLEVPSLGRALMAMQLGRVAEAMLPIALVLFALSAYDSPSLAGLLTFLTVFPGLVAAPVIGALLDRFGRTLLIRADYLVGAALVGAIGLLSFSSVPAAGLLMALTFVHGVTQMFSDAGFRSLFAQLVPSHLWERVNAADSSGYQVAWIAGPPIAATLFALAGAPVTFIVVGIMYGVSALALIGLREPVGARPQSLDIARATAVGLAYVWRNRTLRGLAASVSVTNVGFGIVTILVPIILVDRLVAPEYVVGLAFALSGIFGVLAAVIFGRTDTLGRERLLIVVAQAGITISAALLLPAAAASMVIGVAWILAAMVLFGLSGGIWDIGIFTVRQRRTDPEMMGRAFATSMALNQSGFPIGAAIGGWLAASSIYGAIGLAIALGSMGTILAFLLVPGTDEPHEYPARPNEVG